MILGKSSLTALLIILLVSSIFIFSGCDLLTTSSTTTSDTLIYPPAPEDFDIWADLAIEWAEDKYKQESNEYSGYCLRFVSEAFGLGQNVNFNTTGWNSPLDVKNGLGSQFVSSSQGVSPPRGALVFFSASGYYHYPDDGTINLAEYGHIGIYLGDNQVIHAFGAVKPQSIAEVENCSGIDSEGNVFQIDAYIGWAYPPEEWRPPPTLQSPGSADSPGECIYTLTPDFEWYSSVGNPEYYRLYIRNLDTNEFPFDSLRDNIIITETPYHLPYGYLEWGKHYKWDMQASYNGVWTTYSNDFYFQTCEIATTFPTVDTFYISNNTFTLGESIIFSFTVSAHSGSGLKQVELWEASDTDGDGEPNWPDSPTGYIDVQTINGQVYTGFFEYTLQKTGTFWYGIHVVDNAGNWNDERNSHSNGLPGIFGPLKIYITL